MDEGSASRSGGLVACCGIFQALNYGGLSAPIVADNDCNGGEEFNDRDGFVIERANSANGKLAYRRHGTQGQERVSDAQIVASHHVLHSQHVMPYMHSSLLYKTPSHSEQRSLIPLYRLTENVSDCSLRYDGPPLRG